MTNLRKSIEPKSDQLNFDDLVGGRTITIKVTKVSESSAKDQPISINFEGDNGKPYKPCKSMRRVLVFAWGDQGSEYVGRSMTLYGDPKVRFGGDEVGGIRISYLSHIDREITMALTVTRANRKPYTVRPLIAAANPTQAVAPPSANVAHLKNQAIALIAGLEMAESSEEVEGFVKKCSDLSVEIAAAGGAKLNDMLLEAVETARGKFAVSPLRGG